MGDAALNSVGLSYCCFQSESNPKPMPGMETEWKDNSSRGGKAALRRSKNGEALQGGKIRAEDPPPPMKSAPMATRQRPCSLTSVPDPSSNASNECVTRCARCSLCCTPYYRDILAPKQTSSLLPPPKNPKSSITRRIACQPAERLLPRQSSVQPDGKCAEQRFFWQPCCRQV